jgi:hypothetical protein
MVLAEKDALEAQRFVVHPEIEIARKIGRHFMWLRVAILTAQLRKKLKHPWLDHPSPVLFLRGEPCGFILKIPARA